MRRAFFWGNGSMWPPQPDISLICFDDVSMYYHYIMCCHHVMLYLCQIWSQWWWSFFLWRFRRKRVNESVKYLKTFWLWISCWQDARRSSWTSLLWLWVIFFLSFWASESSRDGWSIRYAWFLLTGTELGCVQAFTQSYWAYYAWRPTVLY